MGKRDVERHSEGTRHKKNQALIDSSQTVDVFLESADNLSHSKKVKEFFFILYVLIWSSAGHHQNCSVEIVTWTVFSSSSGNGISNSTYTA